MSTALQFLGTVSIVWALAGMVLFASKGEGSAAVVTLVSGLASGLLFFALAGILDGWTSCSAGAVLPQRKRVQRLPPPDLIRS